MTGIELLARVRADVPDAKLLLLTAYADTDVAISAINDIGLDHYLLKPWDPPEDRLYPVTDDLLSDWHNAHPEQTNDVRVVGHRWSEASHLVKTFLANNHVPYVWLDVERDAEGARLRDLAGAPAGGPPARARPRRRDAARPDAGRRSRRPSDCAPAPSATSTTSASSVVARPVSPPRSTPRPRGSAPSSSSTTPPGGQAGQSAADRELPRLPSRAVRRRPRPAGHRPGPALRCRDGAGPGRRRPRGPGPGARRPPRRRRRHRGPQRRARDGCLLPTARRRRASTPWPGAASTTARTPARRRPARATRSTSSARPTPPVRRPSTSPATRAGSRSSCGVTSLEASMSQYLVERIRADERIRVLCRTEVVGGGR